MVWCGLDVNLQWVGDTGRGSCGLMWVGVGSDREVRGTKHVVVWVRCEVAMAGVNGRGSYRLMWVGVGRGQGGWGYNI